EARLRVHPLYWIGTGLLSALGAGLIAGMLQLPFLTARSVHLTLPLLGELHLSTVLLFDLGVYMLVVGATLLILVALAHQSLRSPRKAVTPLDPDSELGSSAGAVEGCWNSSTHWRSACCPAPACGCCCVPAPSRC